MRTLPLLFAIFVAAVYVGVLAQAVAVLVRWSPRAPTITAGACRW
jgi:hypothetical protein